MSKKNAQKVVKAPVALAITKAPKTILEGGLSYSLVSRVLNAMSDEDRKKAEAGEVMDLVDGRGQSQKVSKMAVDLANSIGAKKLSEVKSAFLRPRMVIDWDKRTITLDESKVKVPFIKKPEAERKAAPTGE